MFKIYGMYEMTKVLMFARFSADRFSGGRYHAWLMAEALAEAGHDVLVVANEAPIVAKECADFPAHDAIELLVSRTFQGWERRSWDIVVLVPDILLDAAVFGAALRAQALRRTKMVFLDYEAPTWYNSSVQAPRSPLRTIWWAIAGRQCSLVLSSTEFGMTQAKRYYKPLTGQAGFAVCHAPINDRALPVNPPEVDDRIIFITRKEKLSDHKRAGWILESLSDWCPDGITITLLGDLDPYMLAQLAEATVTRGQRIEHLRRISDTDKFRLIASSRVMVFASSFEGFGLPPVEAACCGTPCVATRLPVLEETVGDGAATFVEQDDAEAMAWHVKAIMSADPPLRLSSEIQQSARDRFGFVAAYQPRIADLFVQLAASPPGSSRTLELWAARALYKLWSLCFRMVR